MCGEKVAVVGFSWNCWGSPPRVRGEGDVAQALAPYPGITPACAGRSRASIVSGRPSQDHPRVCGEKHSSRLQTSPLTGSPPRVRGEDIECTKHHVVLGITPACAGRRGCAEEQGTPSRDHPRVCGEKSGLRDIMERYTGSPPRVRGEAYCHTSAIALKRITPACAGRRSMEVVV